MKDFKIPASKIRRSAVSLLILATALNAFNGNCVAADERMQLSDLKRESIRIERPEPDPRGGRAFRLLYVVDVPVNIYWRFKTDFNNRFVARNKFVIAHTYLGGDDTTVVTENRYRHAPELTFRWKTTVHRDSRQLHFTLINPEKCRHKFHYGTIRVEPFNGKTRVIHEGYFDFVGDFIWANLPIPGGMSDFLTYTAGWEQKTVKQLSGIYEATKPDVPTMTYDEFRTYSPR